MISLKELKIDLFQLLMALSKALDFGSKGVMHHHVRVALIAKQLAKSLKLPSSQVREAVYSSMLHDIGAITWDEKDQLQDFEVKTPHSHSERGAVLLAKSPLFSRLTDVILYHHDNWDGRNGAVLKGSELPLLSRIIHLADRIDVLIDENVYILEQRDEILRTIKDYTGKMFDPLLVEALMELAQKESFWLDLTADNMEDLLLSGMESHKRTINLMELISIGEIFAKVIDGKSPFTHYHSRMVAAVAAHMGRLAGYSEEKCQAMRLAGLLHDLGKMAVPERILVKPGRLDAAEYNIIKSHTYYTYRILERVEGFEDINQWASYHHECLTGNGYPFRKKAEELSDEARIMAVCDIFTALVEDRPYREGLPREKVEQILLHKAEKKDIDGKWVQLLLENYHQLALYKDL